VSTSQPVSDGLFLPQPETGNPPYLKLYLQALFGPRGLNSDPGRCLPPIMPRRKFELKDLPEDPKRLQQLIEDVADRSVDPDIEDMLKMPKTRDATLRTGLSTKFELTLPIQKKGAFAQSRGHVAPKYCKCCADNGGPFTECVLLDGHLGGGCANCYLTRQNGRPVICSHATEGMWLFSVGRRQGSR
jgi:hypothetical protein